MPVVTTRQLDQFLMDGGGLFVIRDSEGKVVECRIASDGDAVYLSIFGIYEKAGLVVPESLARARPQQRKAEKVTTHV